MRRSPYKPVLIAAALLALAILTAGCSSDVARLTQAGNQAFARQAYDEALKSYQAAQARMPELAELHYNAANARYRQGKYAEASQDFGKALQYATDDRVAQESYYNQGNAAYNDNQMEAAVESYTQALLRDPNDAGAKYNLELALQKKQNQQNQNQQNQDQQNQDQNNPLNMDQQQNQQQPGQRQQNQQKQNQPQQNPQKQRPGQPDPQQQNPRQPPQNTQSGPGQGMTEEQARQLLSAIARKSGNLQGQLGEGQSARDNPPAQDW